MSERDLYDLIRDAAQFSACRGGHGDAIAVCNIDEVREWFGNREPMPGSALATVLVDGVGPIAIMRSPDQSRGAVRVEFATQYRAERAAGGGQVFVTPGGFAGGCVDIGGGGGVPGEAATATVRGMGGGGSRMGEGWQVSNDGKTWMDADPNTDGQAFRYKRIKPQP
jgi:hypothetical protein